MKIKLLSILYSITILGLFLYSYTQVDLGLTLSKFSVWQVVEKSLQYIGYFERPISTELYISILFLLFGCYIGFLVAVKKKLLTRKHAWMLIIFTAILLTFSYNAFSYDLFNYIFDAKIIIHYHMNPYMHKALDFPQDPMLSFMHWVERTYPYGPLWLLVTLPFSFLGGQVFLITFYLFKLIGSLSFLGTSYFIEKIAKKIFPEESLFTLVLFAFSPLVIIEALVSAHNDILMIFLSSLALFLLLQKGYMTSGISFIAGVAVKFATAVWLPLWLVLFYLQAKKKHISFEGLMQAGAVLSLLPVFLATFRTNFQPWYFLYIFPFAVLARKTYIFVPVTIFSFFALLQYIPFLYSGNWNPPIPTLLNQISLAGMSVSLITMAFLFYFNLTVAKKQ